MTVTCPYCHEPAEMVPGAVLYQGRPGLEDIAALNFWRCAPCGASIGTHAKGAMTDRGESDGTMPLGTLANKQLRADRQAVHRKLDPLWMAAADRRGARKQVYAWLADKMCLPVGKCHIGEFGTLDCALALKILRYEIPPSFPVGRHRKNKTTR